MNESRIVDINRRRALNSYIDIEEFKKIEDEKSIKRMRGYCRKLPAMVQNNGLIETLVFFKSKMKAENSKNEYNYIYEWIEEWMKNNSYIEKESDLLRILMSSSDYDYRKYTEEVMNILLWYKRNAEGLL